MNFIGIDYGNKAHCVNIINMVGEKNKNLKLIMT